MRKKKPLQRMIKRTFDICAALAGLMLLSPLMLIAACKIYREMGRPLFFNAVRAGAGGRPFRLYKFRTMTNERDECGNLLPDAERLTPLGKKLRSTSIDELPQLLNVVKGDMSLVGPRPLPLEYVPRYSAVQKKRLDVPQGITGWAQIHGRNAISWEEKFSRDIWYVENWSLFLDARIIAATLKKVLSREGISAEGEATMPEFRGGGNDG